MTSLLSSLVHPFSSQKELSKPEEPEQTLNLQITSKMPGLIKKYKAACVTAEPGWFDLELSVQKTIHWINEAGKAGVKFLAFPEVCMSRPNVSPFITSTLIPYSPNMTKGFLATPTGCGR